MKVLALTEDCWPQADRRLWDALVAKGGPLDDRGALAHLRDASVRSLRRRYAYWLGWLSREDPDALYAGPLGRATADRLRAWIEGRADLAAMSRFTMLEAVLRVLSAAAPDAEWTAQRRLLALRRREAFDNFGARKQGRIVAAELLVDAGFEMIAAANSASTELQAHKLRRDGLLIAFLALMPMRRRALCAMQLNENLLIAEDHIVIHLPHPLCKAGGPWDAPLPRLLDAPMRDYVSTVRPWFLRRNDARHDALWVGDRGQPCGAEHLGHRIARLTEKAIGVRLPPQFFRDCAATTLARRSPDAARLIRPILGHTGFRTAERHYNHADTIDAGRRYATLIDTLKDGDP